MRACERHGAQVRIGQVHVPRRLLYSAIISPLFSMAGESLSSSRESARPRIRPAASMPLSSRMLMALSSRAFPGVIVVRFEVGGAPGGGGGCDGGDPGGGGGCDGGVPGGGGGCSSPLGGDERVHARDILSPSMTRRVDIVESW